MKAPKNICQFFFNCSTAIVLSASLRADVLVHAICCQQPLQQNRCLPWHLSGSLCLVHYLLNVEFLFLFLIPVHETSPTKRLTFVSIRQKLNTSLRKSAKQNTSLFFSVLWFLISASNKKKGKKRKKRKVSHLRCVWGNGNCHNVSQGFCVNRVCWQRLSVENCTAKRTQSASPLLKNSSPQTSFSFKGKKDSVAHSSKDLTTNHYGAAIIDQQSPGN